MSIPVDDVSMLEEYLHGVMNRSEHHAKTVGAVALTLIGAVLWKKDKKTPLKVKSYAGQPANIVWFEVNGKRYALRYSHRKGCIELHDRTFRGDVMHQFTNKTPATEVRKIFDAL